MFPTGHDLLLLSAGVESATLLYQLRERPLQPVFIDYGQRAAQQEWHHASALCETLALPLKRFDLGAIGDAFRAEQTHKLHVPVPHRNLFILSLAVSFAAQQEASRIYIALNREDSTQHASASPGFLAQFNALTACLSPSAPGQNGTGATPATIRIQAPLADQSKAQIIRRGQALGLDYRFTYSCLLGHRQHCGGCPQCLHRQRAFAEAGVAEPEDFYRTRA